MCFNRIFGVTPQTLYANVLFDPFEEDFNVPAMAVDVSDFNGGEVKVVGHKGDDFATIGIQRLHQPQLAWIKFLGFRDHKSHDIVGTDGGRLVVTVKNSNHLELHVVLRTHDKESTGKIHSPHLLEINVGFVRRVYCSRLVSD